MNLHAACILQGFGDIPRLDRLEGIFLDLLKCCQQESFPDVIRRLRRGEKNRQKSALLPCIPKLKDGFIRLGGRIDLVKLPYDSRYPPILPGRHTFSMKILTAFPEQLRHVGTNSA